MVKVQLSFLALCFWGQTVAADFYKVSGVKRVEADLYRTSDNYYIQTQYCYHYTYGEDAIIKQDGAGMKIIWDDNTSCQVKRIFRK